MLIRPTRAGAQVPATAHGWLAAALSGILGILAHGLGGGHIPTALQTATIISFAVGVGLVRAGQVRRREQHRRHGRLEGSAFGVTLALAVGQAGTHIVLALVDAHGSHAQSLTPGPVMLAWHVIAVPAAAIVLLVAERLDRAWGTGLARLGRLLSAPGPDTGRCVRSIAAARPAMLSPSPMVDAAGVRGPPVQG